MATLMTVLFDDDEKAKAFEDQIEIDHWAYRGFMPVKVIKSEFLEEFDPDPENRYTEPYTGALPEDQG
jgi:hypothetical protein